MNKIRQWVLNFLKSFKLSGLPAILGLFGAISGQGYKWIRRIIIPLIFTICALIELRSWWVILLMTISGWLSLGYGEDSVLRKFWKQDNYLTRGTIGALLSLSFIVVPILKGNWLFYLLGSLGIILTWALISWRGFGEFKVKLFGKEYNVLKVDFFSYSVLGICGMLIIFKGG
jgi:hypothetical protein